MGRTIFLVALGGMIGTISRFAFTKIMQKYFFADFPIGTFIINISGCFLIGIFWGMSYRFNWANQDFRSLTMIGFCGAYTTFSAFTLENVQLLENGHISTALIYSLASLFIGIILTYLGYWLVRLG